MSADEEFEAWLVDRLKELNTDPDVFFDYIKSILEGEETDEEKIETLDDILSETSGGSVDAICKEILSKWNLINSEKSKNKNETKITVEEQLASIMEKQALSVVETRTLTEEEKRHKQSILAQYGEVCDETEYPLLFVDILILSTSCSYLNVFFIMAIFIDDYGSIPIIKAAFSHGSQYSRTVQKNDNVSAVAQAEVEKREKAKVESEKKKVQDKSNKEKQNQAKQDRKEKEKKRTQKGERRR
ncbi:Coiled-coil domain-containing protein 43 [Nymphon striatum]|nr:Coiled-coil domain-containing protein 43 [Nymphon striatum]